MDEERLGALGDNASSDRTSVDGVKMQWPMEGPSREVKAVDCLLVDEVHG